MPLYKEKEIIEALKASTSLSPENVILGIGDDAAITSVESGYQLVTATDVIVSGSHYPEGINPQAIGHRSLAVNLSDIAAMGATPVWAISRDEPCPRPRPACFRARDRPIQEK